MKVMILSRNLAKDVSPVAQGLGKTAMIRISSLPKSQWPALTFAGEFQDVIEFDFDDVTDGWFNQAVKEEGYSAVLEQARPIELDEAKRIVEFAEKNRDVDTLIVHCDAGVCRSSGVALALCRYVYQDWDNHAMIQKSAKFRPNLTVVDRIREACPMPVYVPFSE